MAVHLLPTRSVRIDVPGDLRSLITVAPELGDLAEVGLSRAGVEQIWGAVEGLYRTGLHPAISLCIRRQGRVVLDRAIGHSSGNGPGDPPDAPRVTATPDTPFCIFSASKAITALLVHHLDDQGLVHIDDRVTEYLPEFGKHGKQDVTIRHVLTHRAGIPSLPADKRIDASVVCDWRRIIEQLCDAQPVWMPGRRLAYHAITGGYVLGEIVRRVTGKDVRQFLREVALDPLGFEGMDYGVPRERLGDVARNYATGREPPFPLSLLVGRALGVSFREAVEISNDPRWLSEIIPAGNIVATANEASRFYQMLLQEGELDGTRVFDKRTVRRARAESSYLEVDLTLGAPLRYGLGFMLGTPYVGLYGPDTEQAFGHLGFIEVFTWADPERALAVALLTSGKPFLGIHLRHVWGVLSAIARNCPKVV
jgi:CubicO group peptidase (beta-lactamase class C family)